MRRDSSLQAVLFDLDDTLAPEVPLTPTALLAAAASVSIPNVAPAALAADAQRAARKGWQNLRASYAPSEVGSWIDRVGIGSAESL